MQITQTERSKTSKHFGHFVKRADAFIQSGSDWMQICVIIGQVEARGIGCEGLNAENMLVWSPTQKPLHYPPNYAFSPGTIRRKHFLTVVNQLFHGRKLCSVNTYNH